VGRRRPTKEGKISGSRFMQHTPSRFLKVAVVSRFLIRHPKVSRFITAHLPALCPFLPVPGAAPVYTMPAPKPPPFH
jgi:hypothetical protein